MKQEEVKQDLPVKSEKEIEQQKIDREKKLKKFRDELDARPWSEPWYFAINRQS